MSRSTKRRMERVRRKYTGSLLRDLTGGTGAIEGSAVVWEGPSMIDGSPIVVIITGMKPGSGSGNSKTGTMAQTYIIRSDMSPMEAIWSVVSIMPSAASAGIGEWRPMGRFQPILTGRAM